MRQPFRRPATLVALVVALSAAAPGTASADVPTSAEIRQVQAVMVAIDDALPRAGLADGVPIYLIEPLRGAVVNLNSGSTEGACNAIASFYGRMKLMYDVGQISADQERFLGYVTLYFVETLDCPTPW